MTEQLQWLPFVNARLHEPFVKFIYWSLRQLDAGTQVTVNQSRSAGKAVFSTAWLPVLLCLRLPCAFSSRHRTLPASLASFTTCSSFSFSVSSLLLRKLPGPFILLAIEYVVWMGNGNTDIPHLSWKKKWHSIWFWKIHNIPLIKYSITVINPPAWTGPAPLRHELQTLAMATGPETTLTSLVWMVSLEAWGSSVLRVELSRVGVWVCRGFQSNL